MKQFSRQKNHRSTIVSKKQSGVAIITALLIVTIAATVSITISTQLQLDVRRTSNLVALDQSDIYALHVEKFTQEKLRDPNDFANLMQVLRESTEKVEFVFPVENGTIEAQLTDLNSCINLNALPDPLVQARLNRLFVQSNIPTSMIPAIIDWIDDDNITTSAPDGAEDGYYLNLENAYRNANQQLSSITETRLIKGASNNQDTPSYATYNRILALAEAFRDNTDNWPSLCAFKTATAPLININTASRDVLLALSPTMTAAVVDSIIACRGPNGAELTNVTDFTSCPNVSTIITGTDLDQLSFTSDYFLLKTKIRVGNAKRITYSMIFRTLTGDSEIISRTQRTL